MKKIALVIAGMIVWAFISLGVAYVFAPMRPLVLEKPKNDEPAVSLLANDGRMAVIYSDGSILTNLKTEREVYRLIWESQVEWKRKSLEAQP